MEEQKSVQKAVEENKASGAVSTDEGSANDDVNVAIIDEQTIRDKIYTVRGMQVMLDFELAEIYGYETKNFNRQVKNNKERFDGDDFMFTLTKDELAEISRCKNFTSIQTKGIKGGRSNAVNAFTEQGVYMLMTVLRGDLAVSQSRALVRAFKAMKDYIAQGRALITQQDYLRISMQMTDTTQELRLLQEKVDENVEQINHIMVRLDDTVKSSDLPATILDLSKPEEQKEWLLLNGEMAKAAETYIDIYAGAKSSIIIVDNYIDIKTLRLLQRVNPSVTVTIVSDNVGNRLHRRDVADFHMEFPGINVSFLQCGCVMHDRFIVIDFGTADEKMYHCGASSKDAGNRTTSITEYSDGAIKNAFGGVVRGMLGNSTLVLR